MRDLQFFEQDAVNNQLTWDRDSKSVMRPRVVGKFIHVENEKFYIKGVSYGAFKPDAAKGEFFDRMQIERDFALMAANGINTVRIPHTTPPVSLLDVASHYGLRVMVGLSAEQYIGYLIDTHKKRPDIEQLIREKVRAVKGHPALLAYAIGNEIPAAVARWLGPAKVEGYLRKIFETVRDEDPDGLITYVNYPTTEYLQLHFLDFVCFNVYLEREEPFRRYLARLQNVAGNRPLVMSEIGLDAFRNGEEKQAEVLNWQVRLSFACGCAGVVLFSWTDEWYRAGADVTDWAFGITDQRRRAKPALYAVKKAFEELPFQSEERWPRFSVAICTYNGSRTIRDTLEGVAKLTYPDFETIVVNDGSTDYTAAIAGEYNCRIISTENRGLSSARNVALGAAQGEIIAYIDDDAIPDPHWLHYLAWAFKNESYAGVGGPNILPPQSNIIAECVDNAPGAPTHVLITDEIAEHLPGCNLAIRKSALQSIGGFDPAFRVAGDDVDVCWRLQEYWQLGFSAGAAVLHHRRHTIDGYWRQQRGYGRAEALLERKWPEKYNSAGHHTFSGRMYGTALFHGLFRRTRIYYGFGGFAPFQSIYERSPGVLLTLPLMPEWYLLILILGFFSLLGVIWKPLLLVIPVAVAGVALTFMHALIGGASFHTAYPRRGVNVMRQCLTAFLYLIQPLARLVGRLTAGLTFWRRRGTRDFAMPYPRWWAAWTNTWIAPENRLAQISQFLRASNAVVRNGGEFDRWDLEIIGGMFGSARTVTGVEDHGGGTQLVRLRSWPRIRHPAKALTVLFTIILITAAFDEAWTIVLVFGAILAWLLWNTFVQAGQSMATLISAVKKIGWFA